ncbi:inactive ribonuclease-like protein 9 [Echinops telfairi]|uniref:Inactive ribonuclease-like protein 9 n=2 Tax=Echinops telfairi TaxID=9371 RepID=A0AC55CW07_ECHTE|nr:inactive ribonuclease-like protein 9 [Echinops telfairi]CDG32153.1 TPA: ribonuclease A K1 [Echinops telfairi]
MWQTSVITHPLSLLLLLFPVQLDGEYIPRTPFQLDEEFVDILEEFYGTGATSEPTKERFEEKSMIEPLDRFIYLKGYCDYEIKYKKVHKKLGCVKEHYFLQEKYEDIRQMCYYSFVRCKNGIRKCHRSKKFMFAVYCKLISGTRLPECYYEGISMRGLALITCKWQNEIGELIPFSIDSISMPY